MRVIKVNTQPTFEVNEVTPNLTLLTLEDALVTDKFDNIDSFELVLFRMPVGGNPEEG